MRNTKTYKICKFCKLTFFLSLQYFATKLGNFTNLKMLFLAVVKDLVIFAKIRIQCKREMVYCADHFAIIANHFVKLMSSLRRFSITLVSPARAERTCESIRFSVPFDARGHALEVEMFFTSMACARVPKRTESLMHAFSCVSSYKFAPPARAK